ncbi:hypothetical protein, partial [Pseudomonas aeruginosa]|uniref:hypothetical protein n=1 Tax=Pseudomonas aeruginosa TaxID=287 RepID=UPI00397D5277
FNSAHLNDINVSSKIFCLTFPFHLKDKRKSEKVGLNLNIQKTKIVESCPFTSWQIDGETGVHRG